MKIRKIKIKGYKVFDDIELDFTDIQGNTLDTIVLAGVNGSGKTTILELIKSLFWFDQYDYSQGIEKTILNYANFPILDCREALIQIESKEFNPDVFPGFFTMLKDEVKKHDEIFSKEKKGLDTAILRTIESFNLQPNEHQSPINTYNFIYKTQLKKGKIIIEQNDFPLLEALLYTSSPQIFYFPANNYLHEKKEQKENGEDIDFHIHQNDIGFVREIDFDLHKIATEKYLVNQIIQKILHERDIPSKQIIQAATEEINGYLKDFPIKTKFIDITSEKETKPIFQSFNGQKITIDDLSNGEKQLFYRAVYLQNLNIQDSIILVDEAEASLHPTWQQEILKLYQNVGKNNQIILATHSPHIIASVKPESLFVLVPEEESGKIKAVNMAKAHKNTKGLEPNRILREIMGTPLRDYETQQKINQVTENLHEENFENPEIQALINQLTEDLGRQDPFIMKVNHQITLFKRKKTQPTKL